MLFEHRATLRSFPFFFFFLFFSFFLLPLSLSLSLLFPLLFSLTVRTTVYILSPMQHARVSDYSKTAHVPGGSGSQPTHLHSCLSLSLSCSLSSLVQCVCDTRTRGMARPKHSMHEHSRLENLSLSLSFSFSRSLAPFGQSASRTSRLATMHPTWHFRPGEKSVAAALSVGSFPSRSTPWNSTPGNLGTRKNFPCLPAELLRYLRDAPRSFIQSLQVYSLIRLMNIAKRRRRTRSWRFNYFLLQKGKFRKFFYILAVSST